MNLTYQRLTGWTLGTAVVTLGVLGVSLLVPGRFLATAVVWAMVVTGAVVGTTLVIRSRRAPTLGGVIESAHSVASVVPARR